MPMEGGGIHDVWDVLFISTLCVMCVLCVAGNVTVILTIFGTPKLRSGSSLLLFNLGVCDLLNGTIRISVVTDSFLRGSRLDQVQIWDPYRHFGSICIWWIDESLYYMDRALRDIFFNWITSTAFGITMTNF